MRGHPVPEMLCKICDKPVDLTVDLCANENGNAVHEDCYVQRIINEFLMRGTPTKTDLINTAGTYLDISAGRKAGKKRACEDDGNSAMPSGG